jgi:hypothetical protein
MSEPFDLDKHRAEQSRARALGMEYAKIHTIILSVFADGDEGISESRAVEMIREMALRAVDKAVAQERDAVLAWCRERSDLWLNVPDGHRVEASMGLWLAMNAIERGEHLKERT